MNVKRRMRLLEVIIGKLQLARDFCGLLNLTPCFEHFVLLDVVIVQRDQTKALSGGRVILGNIVPLCFIKQVFILLSEEHNYTGLVY